MELNKDLDFKKVFKTVFDKLKHDDVSDYDRLEHDQNAEESVKAAMKETYDNTIKMLENANSLEEALAHFSPLRRELIKTTFRCQSFYADIQVGSLFYTVDKIYSSPFYCHEYHFSLLNR